MDSKLKIIFWPNPQLKKVSVPVTTYDAHLAQLAAGMFELMREAKGVGLAAPQVGKSIRMFVMNHDGDPAHDKVYINPQTSDATGDEEDEEGCLSLPKININVFRSTAIHISAYDLSGQRFEEEGTDFIARVWQHEIDHLNGIMLTDRMGPVARMTYRKKLKELEADYADEQAALKKKRR